MQIAGRLTLDAAVDAMGICPSGRNVHVECVADWKRAGAESYTYVARLHSEECDRRIVFKALVPTPGTRSVADAVRVRLRRRALLDRYAVSTVPVYGSGDGTLVEAYLPYQIQAMVRQPRTPLPVASSAEADSLTKGEADADWQIVFDVLYLAVVLDALRFSPVSVFPDLRTDGKRAYVVDFGEDLGEPGSRTTSTAAKQSAIRWLQRTGVELKAAELTMMSDVATSRLSEVEHRQVARRAGE